ncbi:DNA-binding transcriptional LysR family regulator [Rhizobium sp. BE258]|nr:DNA-binding transcriptional LysR family regulator [Rhizobium sp. BE258]
MTKAAELLGITQPSVSNTIAGLESDLGFTLFIRKAGRLYPTPEAHLFFEEVSRSLAAMESTERAAKEIRTGKYGRLSIAAYPSISTALLPRLISLFIEDRPDVHVRLVSGSSKRVSDLAAMKQCDIAIAELPTAHPADRLDRFAYRCDCILPTDHPLTSLERITAKDLDSVPFISLFPDHSTHHQLASAFSRAGSVWNVVAEVDYFASVCELVSAGCGVGIVDSIISTPFTENVVRRPFDPDIVYEIGLLYPEASSSLIAGQFIGLLKTHLGVGELNR